MSQIYENGTYFENNPTWHQEDSKWKAMQVRRMLKKNALSIKKICEIGCGAGNILNWLSNLFNEGKEFIGYEISPQAYELCQEKVKPNLTFKLANLFEESGVYFDLVLAIDVFEHVQDYYGFLRQLKVKANYKLFHIPLDLSVQTVLRASPILKARKQVGHIQYFTKETALETLKDTGYEIIDFFYTASSLELPNRGWKANLLNVFRRLAFTMNQDLTVRILGGYSLLVLAR